MAEGKIMRVVWAGVQGMVGCLHGQGINMPCTDMGGCVSTVEGQLLGRSVFQLYIHIYVYMGIHVLRIIIPQIIPHDRVDYQRSLTGSVFPMWRRSAFAL